MPDAVANQIAAGEVIQRPSSVAKELLENALDAGATCIKIVIEDAGKTLLQVIDNGKGMSRTDARLAFERHATSKIRLASDLFRLHTMGFRGEALPSIAAVAQVELRTRTEEEEVGSELTIEGSKLMEQVPVACPVGAVFSVRNLFFNIPARRKFLRSNQTEMSNVLAEVERVALANPHIAFTVYSEGNKIIDLPEGNFRQRIVNLFGRKMDAVLVPVASDTSIVKIEGFIGLPEAAKKKAARQFFFVNGRFMKHPYFMKAVQMAYERLLPEGRYIPFFIHFQVDPSRIDVNIHPTKTEIKFEDDQAVFQILLSSVREALGKYGAVPAIDFNTAGKPDIPTFSNTKSSAYSMPPPRIHIDTSFNPFDMKDDIEEGHMRSGNASPSTSSPLSRSVPPAFPAMPEDDFQKGDVNQDLLSSSLSEGSDEKNKQEWEQLGNIEVLQCKGRYLVTSMQDGLALIDMHRAHIRILYEQYMKQQQSHQASSQRMLFPEMITTSPSEAVVLQRIMPQLLDVGFDLSPLGQTSFSILAVPMGTEGLNAVDIVSSILTDAMTGQADVADAIGHIISLALARKVAIPIGQVLNKEEMVALIGKLFNCSIPNLTPDGDPTFVILSPESLF